MFSRRSITKHRIFSDTRHEGGEREKNNTVETSCIARFKLYIRVISYGNSENGKGHQEWGKKLLRWKVSFILTVRYHLQRWRETTLLRKVARASSSSRDEKIMETLFLSVGGNRNKFERTDIIEKERWKVFFFFFIFEDVVICGTIDHKSLIHEEIDFDENFCVCIEIYFLLSIFTIFLKKKKISYIRIIFGFDKTIYINRICNKVIFQTTICLILNWIMLKLK